MYLSLITSLSLLRLSDAWTTTISFENYIERLRENPIGITSGISLQPFEWNPVQITLAMLQVSGRNPSLAGSYYEQIYPNPTRLPNDRPPSAYDAFHSTAAICDHCGPFFTSVGSCTNVPPRTCCRSITPYVTNGKFSSLPHGAISAFWGPGANSDSMNGCEERILESHYGDWQWWWQNPAWPPRVSGASYITCPSATISRGWGAALAGFCARLRKRESGSAAAPAPAWVWPDLITIAGVNYTDGRKGNLLYYDSKDRLINLTHLYKAI